MINERARIAYDIAGQRLAKAGEGAYRAALMSVTKRDIALATGEATEEEDYAVNDPALHAELSKEADSLARAALSMIARQTAGRDGINYHDALAALGQNDYELHYRAAYKHLIQKRLNQN